MTLQCRLAVKTETTGRMPEEGERMMGASKMRVERIEVRGRLKSISSAWWGYRCGRRTWGMIEQTPIVFHDQRNNRKTPRAGDYRSGGSER